MKFSNVIIAIPMICLTFSPILPLLITAPPSKSDVEYALDFAGPKMDNVLDKYNMLTYFSFYTFFKSGIEPDCIDMKSFKIDKTDIS